MQTITHYCGNSKCKTVVENRGDFCEKHVNEKTKEAPASSKQLDKDVKGK